MEIVALIKAGALLIGAVTALITCLQAFRKRDPLPKSPKLEAALDRASLLPKGFLRNGNPGKGK